MAEEIKRLEEEFERMRKLSAPLTEQTINTLSERLFDSRLAEQTADLTKEERIEVYRLKLIIELYWKKYANPKSPLYNHFDNLLLYWLNTSKSLGRKSRTEIVDMFRGFYAVWKEEKEKEIKR